jgi:hypothetical protein
MDELIKILSTSQITWATASVIIAYLMRPVLLKLLDLITINQEAKRKIETDRMSNERDQTTMLGLLRDELVINRGIQNQLITHVNAIPNTLTALQDMMVAKVGEADRKREAIHTDLKTIPLEVWKLGDPKLDTLKSDLQSWIDNLQSRLQEQIDPHAENARKLICKEFETMIDRLGEIEKALKILTPPPPTPFSAPIKGGKDDDTIKEDIA